MNKKSIFSAMLILCAVAVPAALSPWAGAEKDISALDLYDWCRSLSSEEFEGRLSGHAGYNRAAAWAADQFRSWGLLPLLNDNGYLQAFPSPLTQIEQAELRVELSAPAGGREKTEPVLQAEAMKDFLPLVFSDSGSHEADLVFCGWGISAPELGYDDYAGHDVRGKFVVVFRGVPDRSERRFQPHDEHRTRMRVAMERGAAGLVYVYPEVNVHPNGDFTPGFYPLMISDEFADRLFKVHDLNSRQLRADLARYRRPLSFPMQARFNYRVRTSHDPAAVSYNVAGWIPGSDPQLRNEVLILGGHLDGVGRQMGFFCPGANDNASGSAVLLGLARALSRLPRAPKRSIMIVLFGGEEKGMQGSNHFAANLPPPFEKMTAMFNFDMAGAGNRAFASISPQPAELRAAVLKADQARGLLIGTREMGPPGVRGGDVTAFWNLGVPCVYFMTNGPFPDYHRPGDSIFRVNPEIMAELAGLALRAACIFADR